MTIALDNVVAVVTGAAGGIGRATVQAMKDAHATKPGWSELARIGIFFAANSTRVLNSSVAG